MSFCLKVKMIHHSFFINFYFIFYFCIFHLQHEENYFLKTEKINKKSSERENMREKGKIEVIFQYERIMFVACLREYKQEHVKEEFSKEEGNLNITNE